MSLCPCGSGRDLAECCGPILSGDRPAESAEALMRSRYTAYVLGDIRHLGASLHPDSRKDWDEAATRRWAESAEWQSLEILTVEAGQSGDAEGYVEFAASFKEKGQTRRHHERARFTRHAGRWHYLDGTTPRAATLRHETPKIGRNDPCPCGSGKKYKKCCGAG